MKEDPKRESSTAEEVTLWVKAVEAGDQSAASQLWSYCFPQLVKHSKKKLPENLRRTLDEEDVALSAFKSFCLGAAGGAFPDLEGRDDLWKLLVCIAGRKAQAHMRHELREKRGGGQTRGESIFLKQGGSDSPSGLDRVSSESASPALLAQFTDDCRQLLDMLNDDTLRTIALLRVEGYSVSEIAERLDCAKRSVERRLNLIRRTWTDNYPPEDAPLPPKP